MSDDDRRAFWELVVEVAPAWQRAHLADRLAFASRQGVPLGAYELRFNGYAVVAVDFLDDGVVSVRFPMSAPVLATEEGARLLGSSLMEALRVAALLRGLL